MRLRFTLLMRYRKSAFRGNLKKILPRLWGLRIISCTFADGKFFAAVRPEQASAAPALFAGAAPGRMCLP